MSATVTPDSTGADDHRLPRRLTGPAAAMLVAKHAYTDRFFQAPPPDEPGLGAPAVAAATARDLAA
ncbi:hypothetical protein SLNWT_2969 [Streptomyces albus]|uniref:Uncharacterized protein n=1 Tax=Streptomyces albus (strain ATCC 21838 / DSM 41398 / FERM P-419 / JCM 4703 / NBRC 107858) TaxID=1081613 RepID=A0A0B5EVW1_STRA4|nr:hypothetical protein SLNWT_2969 [Streptomyces albus]AOU77656.1 hypothetical protein SLNHY_2965 [Streptomyces albus]AYN33422.1 hypothetical protein DUI70_2921 [Streptomyces albus]